MTRPVAVLRPEPGNARTAAAIEAAGLTAIRLPLFVVAPVAWQPPDPAAFDAILMTSANTVRHGGAGLARLAELPVHAVGAATATAARAAGFRVASVGTQDAAALAATIPVPTRLLHLAGRERVELPGITSVTVYAADPAPVPIDIASVLAGRVVLLHSTRAARRLAELVAERAAIRLVAIAPAVAKAAGDGWEMVLIAREPRDDAMIAHAGQLAD